MALGEAGVAQSAPATTAEASTASPTTAPTDEKEPDALWITHHTLTLEGREPHYTATAGLQPQKDDSGATKASVFFVAYTLDDVAHRAQRPITFVFNGGPGAASVWLHLGAVGPRRVCLDDAGLPAGPPYRLVPNGSTWLDMTDLVFIDPVGTGYSRMAAGQKREQFYGVKEDAASVGDFIRLYLTRSGRWPSPKFLAGESYGTTRAAALSQYLTDRHGIDVNGIILISAVLNFQVINANKGVDLPYPLALPSLTATAWYHHKLPADLQGDLANTLKEAQQFASGEYATALYQGDGLPDARRQAIAAKLERYTGLDRKTILAAHLRISPMLFEKKLLEDQEKVIGRFDGRITGPAAANPEPSPEYDPSLSRYLPLYTACINDYLRNELRYRSDLPYEVLTGQVHPWNFGPDGSNGLYVGDDLRQTMQQHPGLKVMFASGYMDLATPFAATEYTIDHLGLPPELRSNIRRCYYPAGHMVYHDPTSLEKLHEDVKGFVNASLAGRGGAAR